MQDDQTSEVLNPPGRRRRGREEIETLLCDAARAVFAELGYHGATTREIAQRAGVSETLLFRYFGSKERIFDAVVAQPFRAMIGDFSQHLPTRHFSAANTDAFVGEAYKLAARNRELLKAFLLHAMAPGAQTDAFHGFDAFFAFAASQLETQYAQTGRRPDLDIDLAVRLGFTMLVTAALAEPWLFGGAEDHKDHIRETLQKMIFKALAPD